MAPIFLKTEEERVANLIVERLVMKMSDPETVEAISSVWGAALDKSLGRGLRKVVWTIALVLIGLGIVKLNLFSLLFMGK